MTPRIPDTLAELRRRFASQLSDRLDTLRAQYQALNPAAWEPSKAEALHHLVHSLTGSAGTFGMHFVSDAARALETRLAALLKVERPPSEVEWQGIAAALEHLEQLVHRQQNTDAPSLQQSPTPPHFDRSPLIYLLEDDPVQAVHLRQALQGDGYRVRMFTKPDEFRAAYAATDAERPTAVVVDMIFPEGNDMGATLIAELGLGNTVGIPVVVTSVRDDLPGRLAAFRAGASRYLTKPVDPGHLLNLLDALTGRQPPQPYRVLLVDDDPLLLEAEAAVLREAGMTVHTLSEPLRVLDEVDDFVPDVVVLDVHMPDATGPELAAVLRERDAQLHTPILFLSAETDMSQQLLALNLGGDDFLVKPVRPEHLVAAVTARAQRARQNSAIHQRLETTLYEREREHLALDQHAIVSITDREGIITYTNDLFCQVSGYSHDELLGQNHRIIKSGQHPPEYYQHLWDTIASGNVWQGEICNRRKDGSLYWVESTITPFLDSRGEPYQYVSIRTDITHMKESEAALRKSESRLNFLLTSTPVTIYTCMVTPPFGATYISPNIEQFMGYETEQFTENSDFWAENIHPEDRERVFAELTQLFKNGVHHHDYRFRVSDGSYKWVHDELRLVQDESGEPVEIIGYWADVTDSKVVEQALIAARDEAERANQAKSDFLSSMSHELRTPMNAILGFGQLLERDDTLGGDQVDGVREILKAGYHLLDLIDEVLDLAKIESGRIELSLEPVAVCPVVDECLGLIAGMADKRNIHLSHRGLDGIEVRADRTRLKQVLLNLLTNAIKYNDEGGHVILEVMPVGTDRLRIQVMDTGPGISADRIEELFQPFNRLDAENSEIEGTGIGLTITRRIVEMMGGTVDVESKVGVGSTFWIELPLESMHGAYHDDEHKRATTPRATNALAKNSEPMQNTLLYIEDNPANLKLVAHILGRRKHIRLLTAHSPELGIELALAHRPKLILLDINMPGMNGYQILKVFKAEASLKAIPVVAITANAMPRDIERGKAAGFDEYLTKPLNVAQFLRIIDRCLTG